jgi:hypothetical protein
MKRPVPVVLSAILLGLLAVLQLVGAFGMTAVGFMTLHKGLPGVPPSSPLPSSALPILFFGMALFVAAVAAWSILTLIGLLRLRSWARYSVLVIAGCMTIFGAILTVTSVATPFLTTAGGNDSNALRGTFFAIAAVYAVSTAIGIVLLIYYNLAATRELFLLAAPTRLEPPHTSTGKRRPTAITVISCFYLGSAPFCLPYLFLPFPLFLFGFIFYGLAAHLIYAAFCALTFAIGYGLFRLREEARLAVFWLLALCPVNLLVLLTPWGSRQFRVYMDAINRLTRSMMPTTQPSQNFATSPGTIFFFSVVGLAGYAVILWFLHRHRAAFTPAPSPPPLPLPTIA